jgi:hypothetical protein
MVGVASAVAAAAVVGAGVSIYSANKAAGAVKDASNSSIAEQRSEYNQSRADNAPFRTTGVSALDQVAKLYGLDTTDANGNVVKGSGKADFSSFTTSPDFQFNQQQGQDAINRSAAARGGLLSGAAVKAGQTFASGLASNQFNSYVGNLEGVAGQGQAATNATTAAGTNMANQNSAAIMSAGNARASAYSDMGSTIGNSVNGLAGNYLMYKYLNPAGGAPPPNAGGNMYTARDGYTTTW